MAHLESLEAIRSYVYDKLLDNKIKLIKNTNGYIQFKTVKRTYPKFISFQDLKNDLDDFVQQIMVKTNGKKICFVPGSLRYFNNEATLDHSESMTLVIDLYRKHEFAKNSYSETSS